MNNYSECDSLIGDISWPRVVVNTLICVATIGLMRFLLMFFGAVDYYTNSSPDAEQRAVAQLQAGALLVLLIPISFRVFFCFSSGRTRAKHFSIFLVMYGISAIIFWLGAMLQSKCFSGSLLVDSIATGIGVVFLVTLGLTILSGLVAFK